MTADIVARGNLAALEQMDPAVREEAVTRYLEHARDQLTLAVNLSGPEAVAAIKAEIATAAEATKQLGLSKEIQSDAQEMVRRAEYALGKAIRAGQERGEIATRAEAHSYAGRVARANQRGDTELIERKPPPSDFESHHTLAGTGSSVGIYEMTDGVTGSEFDAALEDAKAEGNLSRANVVRKIKGVKLNGLTPLEKLVKIRALAPTGNTSGQIAKELGLSEDYVRKVARDNGIEITADKVLAGTHRSRIDSNHVVQETINTLDGLAMGIRLINYDDLDTTQAENWASSLTQSIDALKQMNKKIKEMTQ